jgi:hypothetical protein
MWDGVDPIAPDMRGVYVGIGIAGAFIVGAGGYLIWFFASHACV